MEMYRPKVYKITKFGHGNIFRCKCAKNYKIRLRFHKAISISHQANGNVYFFGPPCILTRWLHDLTEWADRRSFSSRIWLLPTTGRPLARSASYTVCCCAIFLLFPNFRPHRIHNVHHAAYCDPLSRSVGLSVGQTVSHAAASKKNNWIDRVLIQDGPVLSMARGEGRILPIVKQRRFDAACRQITSASCSGLLLLH